mmetsp:Transcript_70200/g.199030  ORF Transcript_70200/g.199030 Transcript_70200/m.199030 type:complete len:218 (-) Transcript_70200:1084-1737(-)
MEQQTERRKPQRRTSSLEKASEPHDRNTRSSTPSQGPAAARSEAAIMYAAPPASSRTRNWEPPSEMQWAEMCRIPGLGRVNSTSRSRSTVATRTSVYTPLAAWSACRSARTSSGLTCSPVRSGDAYRKRTGTNGSAGIRSVLPPSGSMSGIARGASLGAGLVSSAGCTGSVTASTPALLKSCTSSLRFEMGKQLALSVSTPGPSSSSDELQIASKRE